MTTLRGARVVGRDPGCDTVLAGDEISRRHAEFCAEGPVSSVRDLDSRNGLFVNGQRREHAELAGGDVIRCGEWVGVVGAIAHDDPGFGEIVPGWYGGAALHRAAEIGRRVAQSELPVVVQGETGTGKEGMARAIHAWSRRTGPLVPVNCAAIPERLAEAELFGYRKGAFTGAEKPGTGLLRAAHNGTLLLDEVLELPPLVQPKLLRFLEQKEVLGLGETVPVSCDVRVIAASQEPLGDAVARGAFRADLRARLEGVIIELVPLRSRREDVVPLFLEFLGTHARHVPPAVEAKVAEALCLYDWPLNVRELALLTRGLLEIHASEPLLRRTHLPERITCRPSAQAPSPSAVASPPKRAWRRVDDRSEFEALVEALRAHHGSVTQACATLGMARNRAYRLLATQADFSLDALRRPRLDR